MLMTATSRFTIVVSLLVASWMWFQDRKMTIRQRKVQSQFTGKCISLRIPWEIREFDDGKIVQLSEVISEGEKGFVWPMERFFLMREGKDYLRYFPKKYLIESSHLQYRGDKSI